MTLPFHVESSTLRYWLAAQAGGLSPVVKAEDARAEYWREFERGRERFYETWEKRITRLLKLEMELAKRLLQIPSFSRNPDEVSKAPLNSAPEWQDLLGALAKDVGSHFAARVYADLKRPRKAEEDEDDDPWWEYLEEYIERVVANKVRQILATTRDMIREAIEAGIRQGEGVYELSQRIERLYLEQIIPHRSETIARTEVIAASNAASQAAARAVGVPMRKVWLATQDDRTRDAHAEAHGQSRMLDEAYVVNGESLMFPGDSTLGAAADNVINCRCTETYEVV